VHYLCDERSYAERKACRLVKQPRSTQRYRARIDYEERRIRKRLHELAKKHLGSGYRRMTRLLRREGLRVNRKRVQRLWREEGLRNPLRKRRKRARGHSGNSCAVKKAEYKNHVWCWDFTMDETSDGRRWKWFSVVDEFTRECLALEVERRMKAKDVVAILTWLEAKHGTPGAIRSDNGPEFIARAIQRWLATRKVAPLYIAPGSPWENGYSESFNSRMKAEFADRGSFRFAPGGKSFGSGVQAVLESGAVAQRDRIPDAGGIRRCTWAGLRYAPSAPSSINTTTHSHKHWYIKRGQAKNSAKLVRNGSRFCAGRSRRCSSRPES
jgi:transposase InsO family protein